MREYMKNLKRCQKKKLWLRIDFKKNKIRERKRCLKELEYISITEYLYFIEWIIFGIILNKVKIAHLSKIIPFVPLFIPYFYIELKKENMNFKESIKFIVFVYTFLIILLLDINFFWNANNKFFTLNI